MLDEKGQRDIIGELEWLYVIFTSKEKPKDIAYWQGKKDGLRLALAAISTGKNRHHWLLLMRTSKTSSWTEEERDFLESLEADDAG